MLDLHQTVNKSTAFGLISLLLLIWTMSLPLCVSDTYFLAMLGGSTFFGVGTIVFYVIEKRNREIRFTKKGLALLFIAIFLFLLATLLPAI